MDPSEHERLARRRAAHLRQVRRRRLAAGAVLIAIALGILIAAGWTSPGSKTAANRGRRSAPLGTARGAGARVSVLVVAAGRLPAPVQDAAVAAIGPDSALLIGGLDRGETSVTDVVRVSGSEATRTGALPTAVHDASAAAVDGQAYLFGGGDLTSFSGISRVASTGAVQSAGQLPAPASDLSTAVISNTVYIVGGYTGQAPLRTILAWRPGGAPPRVVGLLPKVLRYAAVAEQQGKLVIAGGTSGVASSEEVYRFDPSTGRVTTFAHLPQPVTHAAAASLNGTVFVLGGRDASANSQTRRILAISTGGTVTTAGVLPVALSDLAALTLGERILIAGGRDSGGHVHDAVLTLRVRPG